MLPPLASALIAAPSVAIRIEGFTDSEGDLEQNERLASARATSVGKRLEALGVPSTRIETMGRAAADPVASNETPEGRARNRRVEFVIAPR